MPTSGVVRRVANAILEKHSKKSTAAMFASYRSIVRGSPNTSVCGFLCERAVLYRLSTDISALCTAAAEAAGAVSALAPFAAAIANHKDRVPVVRRFEAKTERAAVDESRKRRELTVLVPMHWAYPCVDALLYVPASAQEIATATAAVAATATSGTASAADADTKQRAVPSASASASTLSTGASKEGAGMSVTTKAVEGYLLLIHMTLAPVATHTDAYERWALKHGQWRHELRSPNNVQFVWLWVTRTAVDARSVAFTQLPAVPTGRVTRRNATPRPPFAAPQFGVSIGALDTALSADVEAVYDKAVPDPFGSSK